MIRHANAMLLVEGGKHRFKAWTILWIKPNVKPGSPIGRESLKFFAPHFAHMWSRHNSTSLAGMLVGFMELVHERESQYHPAWERDWRVGSLLLHGDWISLACFLWRPFVPWLDSVFHEFCFWTLLDTHTRTHKHTHRFLSITHTFDDTPPCQPFSNYTLKSASNNCNF